MMTIFKSKNLEKDGESNSERDRKLSVPEERSTGQTVPDGDALASSDTDPGSVSPLAPPLTSKPTSESDSEGDGKLGGSAFTDKVL